MNAATTEGEQLPLHLLATRALSLADENVHRSRQRENVEKCLVLYLNAEPRPTTDFMTSLQALPDWLSDQAVVHPIVQNLLNDKISQRFPTGVILLDLYFLMIVIIAYSFVILQSIENRFPRGTLPENVPISDRRVDLNYLLPLYVGAFYFLVRELVQMLSLAALGLFRSYVTDSANWMDVTFISLTTVWAVMMQTGLGDSYVFRTGTSFSLLFMWINVLVFLKSMFIDFAVFVSGVVYVVQRLAAFLMALSVILIAFAQMFLTLFRKTEFCTSPENVDTVKPFCDTFWISFLKVYTMLLGEVDESLFFSSSFAMVLFLIFMFLVVILLANVLIAIVTDSYGVIKNERAAIVFWNNRLDFVAEMVRGQIYDF